ncbi:hypothetical protein IscW_ISCW012748 [Ixodes scapularis]|uniref:Uncharacterized protein n=1 Tax=Ixodes scapularis TaxID=6945 RepID=B7QEZ4_IXOSC|nr:hypothetical protein IscW_ISCW012748 [Ixodes scapularis]|eukprot:XP_002414108.1 hypothetical protein IscW_ISCW012748 [Ixodes scapularis]
MLLSLFVFVTGKPFSVVFYAGEFSAECFLPRVRLCVNVCWLVCVRFQPPLIRFPPSPLRYCAAVLTTTLLIVVYLWLPACERERKNIYSSAASSAHLYRGCVY